MTTVTLRPAPVSAPVTITLTEDTISDGAVSLALADILHVRHSSRLFRRVRSDYVDLTDRAGARLRIACSGPAGRWGGFEDSAAFITLTAALASALAERQPELTVCLEDSMLWRRVCFGMGLVTALSGAGVAGFAIHDGVDMDRAAGPLVVMGGMALFGAFLAWSSRPWRPERTIPMATWRALTAQAALQCAAT
ncbi:MAG: hypothetical protein GC187_04150 [Alphaproteobacteria bacterium]|nr:hypothetical protein [Alphaproteobacteria bacterium]